MITLHKRTRSLIVFGMCFFLVFCISANDRDVSDFSWNKLRFVRAGALSNPDISEWDETSKITSVNIKESGEICIDHTAKNRWKDAGRGIAGNPWIIIKINGKYYAATYEWLRPGQTCKFGHVHRGISGRFNNGKYSLQAHSKVEPIKSWKPKLGEEIVGFMLSTLARTRGSGSNGQERSNVHWYRLPRLDGTGGGSVEGSGSGMPSTSTTLNTTPPKTVVGVCGTYRGRADASCSAGKFHSHPPDTEKEYLWTCRNIPHSTGETQCRQSKSETASTTPASTSSGNTVSPVDCKTLNTQMYVLRKQLDEYKKAYRGKRVKKWFGLKRDSCNNVKMKDREKIERCQGLANSIHNTQRDISASTTEYNKRCRP